MRVNSKSFIKIAFTLCCVLLLSSSCTKEYYDEYYTNEIENPTEIQFSSKTIKKSDWKWNDSKRRYEATFSFPELTDHMYNDGVLSGSVFVVENGEEIQTPMPYIQTWRDGDVIFTETLSFEVSFSKKTITYTLQASDLGWDDYYLPTYDVLLSFIYY